MSSYLLPTLTTAGPNVTTTAPPETVPPSHRSLLDALKRRGRASVPQLADELGLNVETIRDHLKALVGRDLAQRVALVRRGPGRPEIVYALTARAEALFPRREGEVLRELGAYLLRQGHEALLRDFFAKYVDQRRAEVMERVGHLEGRARLEEIARVFTELGFMPEIEDRDDGARLRLCHCPLRDLVHSTRIPCRAEAGFLTELLGRPIARVSYIPDGDASCSYDSARD